MDELNEVRNIYGYHLASDWAMQEALKWLITSDQSGWLMVHLQVNHLFDWPKEWMAATTPSQHARKYLTGPM